MWASRAAAIEVPSSLIRRTRRTRASRAAGASEAGASHPAANPPAPQGAGARPTWRAALFLFLVAAAVYLNCLPNALTQDDLYYIVRNEQIRQAPWSLFLTPYLNSPWYRPVTMLSWAVNYATGGLHPFGFHLLNVVLHGLVTVALYVVLRELLDGLPVSSARTERRRERPRPGFALGLPLDAPFAAALLFAVHPIHVEAVAAAVGRAELLAAGFVLGAWWLHLRGRPWAAAVSFLVALGSKESAAVFLALPPLGDWACRSRRAPRAYALYAGALGLYTAMRLYAVGSPDLEVVPFLDNPLGALPASLRVANALRVQWRYVALQLFPATLSADYSFDAIPASRSPGELWPALLGAGAVLGLWVWSFWRDARVFLAVGIYAVGFALTANVLVPIPTILGERLAYLPSAGLCLLGGLGCEWLAARSRFAAAASLAVLATALATRTIVRNRDWRDNLTLYTAAVAAVPQSAKARHNLGVELMDRGDLEGARVQLDAAYRIRSAYPDLLGSLGVLHYRRGDKASAARFMGEALGLSGPENPNHYDLAVNYAGVLIDLGRYDEALRLLDGVVTEMPRLARAYSQRAVLHLRRQEWPAARTDLETVLRLDPSDGKARELLTALAGQGAAGETGGDPR